MSEKENEQIGSLSGTAAGVLAGASIGSAIFPVVGTFAGALAGGMMGGLVGRVVGGGILNAIDPSVASVDVHHPTSHESANDDVISQLERLGHLRTQGLITEEEFTAAKAKILGA